MRSLAERFLEADAANPEVWELFERFTLELIARGFFHFSADAVLHRVRWEKAFPDAPGSGFRISNSWSAFYARKFANAHPEHRRFFHLRPSQADALFDRHAPSFGTH